MPSPSMATARRMATKSIVCLSVYNAAFMSVMRKSWAMRSFVLSAGVTGVFADGCLVGGYICLCGGEGVAGGDNV